MEILFIIIMVLAQWDAYVGDMGNDVVSMMRWVAAMMLTGAGTCVCAAKVLVFIFVLGLPPAAAYSVAGIGNRAQAPAIYSDVYLGALAKLNLEVWAPVEGRRGVSNWQPIRHHTADSGKSAIQHGRPSARNRDCI